MTYYPPEVWLSENAFISVVTASVETFPKETLGVLIGIRDINLNRILVEYAIAYQTAERTETSVEVNISRKKRTDEFLRHVTRLSIIGDFHSHPGEPVRRIGACALSARDKRSMKNGELGLVVAVDQDSVKREWKHLKKGSLMGCIFPYSLKVTGWLKLEESEEFKIATIHCPFALGLGR